MTPRVSKAIDIFLKAIEEGTLGKGTCKACAVGNLVAAGQGGTISRKLGSFSCSTDNYRWMHLFMTSDREQWINEEFLNSDLVTENISATEFTWQELAKIEYAFETNTDIYWEEYSAKSKEEIRKDQIKGLEAVVQVMLDFDDCRELVQEVFTCKAEVIPV